MTKLSSLSIAVLLLASAAHATNPCDADPKYCADNLAKAAGQAAAGAKQTGQTLKASQAYQAKLQTLAGQTQDLIKTAETSNAKAQKLESDIDVQIKDWTIKLDGRLNQTARDIAFRRIISLVVIKDNIVTYDRALLVSLGRLHEIDDLLPFAGIKADQLWRVEGDLKGIQANAIASVEGIDQEEVALKMTLIQP